MVSPEMKRELKSLSIRLLLVVVIDVFVLLLFIIWINATPDVSILEILILPSLFIINISFAIVSRYIRKKMYSTFLVNSILSPLLFHVLLNGWFWYYDHKYFTVWQFTEDSKLYELMLDKRDTTYNISERFNGSSTQFMSGQYKIRKDSIFLTDTLTPMIIYSDTLKGFGKSAISLRK